MMAGDHPYEQRIFGHLLHGPTNLRMSLLNLWAQAGGTAGEYLAALAHLAQDGPITILRHRDGWTLAAITRASQQAATPEPLPSRLIRARVTTAAGEAIDHRADGEWAVHDDGRVLATPADDLRRLILEAVRQRVLAAPRAMPDLTPGGEPPVALTFFAGANRLVPAVTLRLRVVWPGEPPAPRPRDALTIEHRIVHGGDGGDDLLVTAARLVALFDRQLRAQCALPPTDLTQERSRP